MKSILTIVIALYFNFTFSQLEPTFILKYPTYQLNQSKVTFNLELNNPTEDTLVILKPEPKLFREHYLFSVKKILGIVQYPYSFEMTKTESCSNVESNERPISDLDGCITVQNDMLIKVPPKSLVSLGLISLDVWNETFCSSAKYTFKVNYHVAVQVIDSNTEQKIEKKIDAIEKEILELKEILNETELKQLELEFGLNQLENYLNSIEYIKTLYTNKIQSEFVIAYGR